MLFSTIPNRLDVGSITDETLKNNVFSFVFSISANKYGGFISKRRNKRFIRESSAKCCVILGYNVIVCLFGPQEKGFRDDRYLSFVELWISSFDMVEQLFITAV